MGWHNALTTLRYGERFRLLRKWTQAAFQTKEALDSYIYIQKREVNVLLNSLLYTPDAWATHFTRYVVIVAYA